jgi:LuxR family transcriptional regulator, quorum-sensing system regulator BjaR1
MGVEGTISAIEGCATIDELKQTLQTIAESYGFSAYNFLDVGAPHRDVPFFMGTLRTDFLIGYRDNRLLAVDACVARARRSNLPFTWNDVPIIPYQGVRKSGAQKTMEFAYDHGYREGFVVPFHFSDSIGRVNSSLIVFFWSDKLRRFRFMISRKKFDLHIIMIYWAQRAVDIVGKEFRDGARFAGRGFAFEGDEALSDREREVLSWAARGKSALDTSEIMTLSEQTVKTHIRNAVNKLRANNKTHAVTKAIYLGMIDF